MDAPPCCCVVDVWFWRPRCHLFSPSYAFVSNVSGFGLAILRTYNRYISPPSTHLNNGNTPYVVCYGLCAVGVCLGGAMGLGCLLGLWVVGYGSWVVSYVLWVVRNGLWVTVRAKWVMPLVHGHEWAATCPNRHVDWRMKVAGRRICLRVRHYHLSIRNKSLLARHATILHICNASNGLRAIAHMPLVKFEIVSCDLYWDAGRNPCVGRVPTTCLCHPRAPVLLT